MYVLKISLGGVLEKYSFWLGESWRVSCLCRRPMRYGLYLANFKLAVFNLFFHIGYSDQ